METSNSDFAYVRLEHANPEHKDYVVINWCLTNVCNYACSYCPDDLHNGKAGWPDYYQVVEFCDKVFSHYAGKKIYFEFTGGEVTLWKDLPAVCQFIKNRGGRVGIISNGSRSLDFWEKFIEKIDHVCLSLHPESAKEDHFFEVVKFCSEKVRTHVNFMMAPALFNKVLAFAMRIKEIPNISMAIQPLVKDFGNELFDYNEVQHKVMNSQFDMIVKHIKRNRHFEYYRGAMAMVNEAGERRDIAPQRFISSDRNRWKGWQCHIGLEQIVINMTGDIHRGWCLVGGRIGHISDKALKLPNKPVTCNKDFCHCNLDIMATKTKAEKIDVSQFV